MSFIDKIEDYFNKFSYTENNAVAYRSSGKELTDFNFMISYYRENPDEIPNAIDKLINNVESIETIVRYIFYIGDIREGLGERETFKICFKHIFSYLDNDKIEKLLKIIPEYNRWDLVWKTVFDNEELFKIAVPIINNQLFFDIDNYCNDKPISLIAKWLPSENASSKKTQTMAKTIRKSLHLSPKEYRKVLSTLREYLDIVERKMSSNNWHEIDYEKVPSKANLNYADAFMYNDRERRIKYIEDLKNNKVKINSSIVYPYEIIDKYIKNKTYLNECKYNTVYEQMWECLPKLSIKNTLVVRDGSGSMRSRIANTTPLSVATSLAIYLSENNSDEWKNKFITFSKNPQIIDLSHCETLAEKINQIYKYEDCQNTDIYKTMKLILDIAIRNNVKQNEMPELILIISDMQFDNHKFNINASLFDNIKNEFLMCGYRLPKICFWNVAGNYCGTVPLQENEYGLILCSGFSINIIKMFLSENIDPYKILLDTIYSKRYDKIGEIFN